MDTIGPATVTAQLRRGPSMADGSGKRKCDPTCGLSARGRGGLGVAAAGGVVDTVERVVVARRRRTGAPEPSGEEEGDDFRLRPSVVSELEECSGEGARTVLKAHAWGLSGATRLASPACGRHASRGA
jgi:hypothetical protein